ncbi:protein scarlet-like [Planococcus citri]|uniref:protein scarlet-like n=1 Tax=Planococcus citri TaxID=170843 RepID=UPI0031F80E22
MDPYNDDGEVLTWKNVSAWTKRTIKMKTEIQLLDNVCGIAKSGSLLAVISPSGAGKTTLLAILNGRYKGILKAEIRLNGRLVDPNLMAVNTGYVCQKHCVFEEMLVAEHLEFMARLKMDKNTSREERDQTMLKIVENLSLSHRLGVRISSLSGGQRKRLALAVQLLTKPKILFCDEPTTGLDSYSATNVVKLLRFMADQGKMIICSIHQPTSDIFEMFDSVSLLASGGSLAYHGRVSDISDYFSSLELKCPSTFDLSEYIVSQVTIRPKSIKGSEFDRAKVTGIVEYFHNSEERDVLENLFSQAKAKSKLINDFPTKRSNISRISFFVEFPWLLWRTALLIRRGYKTWTLRFLLYLMVMGCISFPYGVVQIDQTGVQNIQGLLNCLMMEILYCSLYGIIFTFPEEMPVFIQECADRSYSPLSYYTSKMIILSIKSAIEAFIYTNFVFGVTGLNKSLTDYLLCARPVILISLVSSAYGFLLSTAFESITTSSLFSVPFELVNGVFAGLLIRLKSLPWYIGWLKYISFTYYAYEALSIEQWNRYSFIECDKEDATLCYDNGDQVLASFGFDKENIYLDYCGLIVFILIFHVLGFIFLLRRIKISAAY